MSGSPMEWPDRLTSNSNAGPCVAAHPASSSRRVSTTQRVDLRHQAEALGDVEEARRRDQLALVAQPQQQLGGADPAAARGRMIGWGAARSGPRRAPPRCGSASAAGRRSRRAALVALGQDDRPGCGRRPWRRTSRCRRRRARPRRGSAAAANGATPTLAVTRRRDAVERAASSRSARRAARRPARRRRCVAVGEQDARTRRRRAARRRRCSRRSSAQERRRCVMSSSSPALWPSVSLTCLKLSRSSSEERAGRAVASAAVEVPVELALEAATVGEAGERRRGRRDARGGRGSAAGRRCRRR